VAGTHIPDYVTEQLPVLSPTDYTDQDKSFVRDRAFKLVFTSNDLKAVADDACVALTTWDDNHRETLRAELDAYYAQLYGLTRDELHYILDPTEVLGADFPSQTFRVLKEREEKQFGEYRTKRLVLAAFDEISSSERFRGQRRQCNITGNEWTAGD
jgi:hypothetical protein